MIELERTFAVTEERKIVHGIGEMDIDRIVDRLQGSVRGVVFLERTNERPNMETCKIKVISPDDADEQILSGAVDTAIRGLYENHE